MDEKFDQFFEALFQTQISEQVLVRLKQYLEKLPAHSTIKADDLEELITRFEIDAKEKIRPLAKKLQEKE